ncbi:Sec-independent protein translocase protein TatC [Methanimicrococcus sp. At1]|uniref:Sec-independent protein translocase protein TatC n=1 Tax=Methanimicrococcus hacksteinii TaxID=3028293 RepID=A0ABU3VMR7_9EURY|nr:Sec-independent protein translocase protein TatC [Methanimicrococcus sp. At1]
MVAAVVAYPVTDYIISDAIDRSLPHNVRGTEIENYFDQMVIIYDGPFTKTELDIKTLLDNPDIKTLVYTPPVNASDTGQVIQDVIIANTETQSVLDIISLYILGESDLNLSMVLDAVMQGGVTKMTIEDLPETSQIILFRAIPYEKDLLETNTLSEIKDVFENVTGREPMSTLAHLEKDEKSGSGNPSVVYTKPLEVPLLKLKMSLIIAIIAVLPFLFYLGGKEIVKYVDTKKLNLKEKLPFKARWLVLIVLVMFLSFILGAIYSYFFMAPLFIQFLYLSAAASGAQATYSIYEFVSFIAMLTLIFGLIFEFPLIIFILNRLGIVQKRMLTKYRRHAYVLFVILAAVITPPDVISQIIVAIPMIFFYELSVLIVRIFGRKDPPEGTNLI